MHSKRIQRRAMRRGRVVPVDAQPLACPAPSQLRPGASQVLVARNHHPPRQSALASLHPAPPVAPTCRVLLHDTLARPMRRRPVSVGSRSTTFRWLSRHYRNPQMSATQQTLPGDQPDRQACRPTNILQPHQRSQRNSRGARRGQDARDGVVQCLSIERRHGHQPVV